MKSLKYWSWTKNDTTQILRPDRKWRHTNFKDLSGNDVTWMKKTWLEIKSLKYRRLKQKWRQVNFKDLTSNDNTKILEAEQKMLPREY